MIDLAEPPRRGYTGWLLPEGDRAVLHSLIYPHYARFIGHHVTLQFGVDETAPLPSARNGYVIGEADDGCGCQALVVEIDCSTHRPDGSTYHITWSLGEGRKPVESNDVIRRIGWRPISPTLIHLVPTFFSH